MKLKDPYNLLHEAGVTLSDDCGSFKGRCIRYLPHLGRIDIGDNDFDRWANSLELSFDVRQIKGQRQFLKWANTFKEEK